MPGVSGATGLSGGWHVDQLRDCGARGSRIAASLRERLVRHRQLTGKQPTIAVLLPKSRGLQLDSALSPLEVLPSARGAVHRAGYKISLLMDGGIRRGSDVFKAPAWAPMLCCWDDRSCGGSP
jgi:hypothetical protein